MVVTDDVRQLDAMLVLNLLFEVLERQADLALAEGQLVELRRLNVDARAQLLERSLRNAELRLRFVEARALTRELLAGQCGLVGGLAQSTVVQ